MLGLSKARMVALACAGACLWSQAAFAASAATGRTLVKAKLERAYRLAEDGKTREAIAAFGGVLKIDPTNHAATVQLGYLYSGLKQPAAAARLLKTAVTQNPDNMRLRMDLGYAYQALKKMDAARGEFELVAKRPGEFQEQAQAALRVIKDARYAAASGGKQGQVIARAYAALREGDKQAARASFEEAAAMTPKNPAVLKQLGFMNMEEGRLAEAVADFEAARALEPEDYTTVLQLGYLYQRLNKADQAKSAFSSALASSDMKVQQAAQAALKP